VRLTASALDFSRDKERKEIETCNEIGKKYNNIRRKKMTDDKKRSIEKERGVQKGRNRNTPLQSSERKT
jgi:hypothetical protein